MAGGAAENESIKGTFDAISSSIARTLTAAVAVNEWFMRRLFGCMCFVGTTMMVERVADVGGVGRRTLVIFGQEYPMSFDILWKLASLSVTHDASHDGVALVLCCSSHSRGHHPL